MHIEQQLLMRIFSIVIVSLIAICLLIYQSMFIVNERDQAAVLRFGRVVAVKAEPGLYFRLPFSVIGADRVRIFEDRALRLDLPAIRLQVSGGKFYRVNAFAVYKIADPARFLETVSGRLEDAGRRLSTRLESTLREVYGLHSFDDALSVERVSMMEQVSSQLREEAEKLGIMIADVRIVRTELTQPVLRQAYERMKAERFAVAERIRARGRATARRIRANADRIATEIRAEANREAQIIKGQGDAESTRIYARAYSRAPEFYAFYRSMNAYEQAFTPGTTTMVLSPNSGFLRYFEQSSPRRPENAVSTSG